MFVVAVTRWGTPLEAELPSLAKELGEQAYDLRLKLAGTLPAYAYRGPDLTRAQAVLAIMQRRNHGAVACDVEHVHAAESMLTPRAVVFEPDAVRFERGVTQDAIAYADMLAVVHALETNALDGSQKVTERTVSLGRAALSGGLVVSKSESSEKRTQTRDAEQVLYVFRRSGEDPILLRQQAIRVSGQPGTAPRTSLESFQLAISELRRRAPDALYDNRLLTSKRKTVVASHVVTTTSTTTSHSNASENDLAAHLIALGFLKGQL